MIKTLIINNSKSAVTVMQILTPTTLTYNLFNDVKWRGSPEPPPGKGSRLKGEDPHQIPPPSLLLFSTHLKT